MSQCHSFSTTRITFTMHPARITRVEFTNFKAFRRFTVSLDHINVLVGPNNAGKSTVLAAFRTLETVLRRARSQQPELLPDVPAGQLGYRLPETLLPISTENIATDYDDVEAALSFVLSNGNRLAVHFPAARQFYALAETPSGSPKNAAEFKKAFPIQVVAVPMLGPLEHDEPVVERATVVGSLSTHRAPRHFRNFWRYFPDRFEQFAALVRTTWPGMDVEQPEVIVGARSVVAMYCRENRATRELFWAGTGFQVWCQLLTHIVRAAEATLLVIDEPEIFLHPDVQRQLLGLLRSRSLDVVLATHSTEIIGEADPEELLVVDKSLKKARRIRDVEGVQQTLDSLGSVHNIALAQLARTRRLLFTEGAYDFKLLRGFARVAGFLELAAGVGLTHVESGGFANWERIRDFAWGLQKSVGQALRIGAVIDRDYFPTERIEQLLRELREHVAFAAVLVRKEIENYLLVPGALQRALERCLSEQERRGSAPSGPFDVAQALLEITEAMRAPVQARYLSSRSEHLRRSGRATSTVNEETITWFDERWSQLDTRLEIVPGKEALALLRERIQSSTGVSLTDSRILGALRKDEMPLDLRGLLTSLEDFRTSQAHEKHSA